MSGLFSKKPTVAEEMRKQDRALKQTTRSLDRERLALERQEKKLEQDIKKAAKEGNKQVATVLAKQLVQLRNQKTKMFTANSKIQSIGTHAKVMQSNAKMADAMKSTTKTMTNMNKIMNPQKTAETMRDFERESAKMDMTEEMMNDALEDALGEDGDSEEEDAIVNKVLDEIGIEMTGKMMNAPAAHDGRLGENSKQGVTDDDLMAQLEALRS